MISFLFVLFLNHDTLEFLDLFTFLFVVFVNAGRKAHVQFLAHDRPGDAQDSEAEDPDHVIRVQLSDSKRSVSELHDEFIDHDGRNERG